MLFIYLYIYLGESGARVTPFSKNCYAQNQYMKFLTDLNY